MTKFKTILLATMGVLMAGSAATASFAQTPFEATHPRRAEVSRRVAVQERSVVVARHEDRISPRRAAYLRHQDYLIRERARLDAMRHHGHITRREQVALNHRENHVNRQLAR